MTSIFVLTILLAGPPRPTPTAPPCKTTPVITDAAVRLLVPVLSEFLLAHKEQFDSRGRFLGESKHAAIFQDRLGKLLATKGPTASEAIAALMCFYIGEHPAEELLCEAVARGKEIRPFLLRFQSCPPRTGLEPIAPFFTDIPNLRTEALESITRGDKPCEFE